jgi:hypothetical protein
MMRPTTPMSKRHERNLARSPNQVSPIFCYAEEAVEKPGVFIKLHNQRLISVRACGYILLIKADFDFGMRALSMGECSSNVGLARHWLYDQAWPPPSGFASSAGAAPLYQTHPRNFDGRHRAQHMCPARLMSCALTCLRMRYGVVTQYWLTERQQQNDKSIRVLLKSILAFFQKSKAHMRPYARCTWRGL